MIIAKCEICKKEFNTWKCRKKRGAGRFCSKDCLKKYHLTEDYKQTASMSRMGELNPMWKGEEAKKTSGNQRARNLYGKGLCVICDKGGEIHHKDGNPKNNSPRNIVFLCKFHHSLVEGRLVLSAIGASKHAKRQWRDYYQEVPKDEIIKDYKMGIGITDIGKKYGYDRHSVSKWLKMWKAK